MPRPVGTRVPMHQVLASEILDAIGDGTLAVGDRLPPEAELAAQHGVARETVRRSLHHLQQLGMIDRRPRAGTTVIASRPVDGYQPVAQTGADILALAEGTRLPRRKPSSCGSTQRRRTPDRRTAALEVARAARGQGHAGHEAPHLLQRALPPR